MPNTAIADFSTGRLPATESLDVILVGLGHREKSKAEARKRKWLPKLGGYNKGSGRFRSISVRSGLTPYV
jgi:hypothetical protein